MRFLHAGLAALAVVALSAYQAMAVDVQARPGGVNVAVPAAGVHVETAQPNAALNAANVDVRANGRAEARENFREGVRAQGGLITDNRPDQWRYKYEGNRWWYYGPDNRWMWYTQPGGWVYYDQGAGYTAGYGGVQVAPVPDAGYAAPATGYAPGYYYPNSGYYNGYYPGYYGRGAYIGGPRWGVRIGGRW